MAPVDPRIEALQGVLEMIRDHPVPSFDHLKTPTTPGQHAQVGYQQAKQDMAAAVMRGIGAVQKGKL